MRTTLSSRARRAASIAVSAGLLVSTVVGFVTAAPASATAQSFSAVVPVPAAPAATTSVSGAGDGWSLSFYNPTGGERVYTVFHNPASALNISCNIVASGADCWSAYDNGAGYLTFTNTAANGSGALVVSPNHPGNWLDQSTGNLYVWAVDPTTHTTGLAVVNAGTSGNPGTAVSNWIPMSSAGDGAGSTSASGLATPAFVGSKWYEYNAAPTAANSRMLCFDTSTKQACQSSTNAVIGTPSTSALITMGVVDSKVLLLDSSKNVSCFDPTTNALCFNQFNLGYSAGAPIPSLTTTGTVNGFCFLGGTTNANCYTFPGAGATPSALPEPAALATTFASAGYARALNVVIGTRVYVPSNTNSTSAMCFDFKTGAACPNFPVTFSGMTRLYTLNQDPFNQSCIWASADSGTRMQSFDAITGGTCGTRRVQTVSVIPDLTCFANSASPSLTFTSLTVSTSGGSTYGGTINVANEAGAVVDTMSVSTAGAVSPLDTLTAQSHGATPSLVLNVTANSTLITSALTLTFTWTGSSSCAPAAAYVAPTSMTLSGGQGGSQSGSAIAETVTVGSAIVGETPTVSGLASGVTVTSYVLDTSTTAANAPSLAFDTSTGVLSGTPTSVGGPWTYTVKATLSNSTTLTATYTLTVVAPTPAVTLAGGANGTQSGNAIAETVTVNTAIHGETPTVTNATVDTATGFTLDSCNTQSPCPPAWMTFDTATGMISGTPTDTQTAVEYTISAHLVGGSTLTGHYTLTVVPPPTISLTDGSQSGSAVADTVTVNHAVPGTSATLTNVSSCTVSPALPSGLTLNATTCAISGSPSAVQSAQTYTITAHGTYGGAATATYTLTVLDGPSMSLAGGQNGTQSGNAIAETVTVRSPIVGETPTLASLPNGVTLTEYSLTTPGGAPTLTFDTSTGVLSGTPSSEGGPWTYTVTAHLSDNSTLTATYTLTVTPLATHSVTTGTNGSGSVGLSATGPFTQGTTVTATATPASGWHFTG